MAEYGTPGPQMLMASSMQSFAVCTSSVALPMKLSRWVKHLRDNWKLGEELCVQNKTNLGSTQPTRNVREESPWKPSMKEVTSMFTISPAHNGLASGMPWQTYRKREMEENEGAWAKFQAASGSSCENNATAIMTTMQLRAWEKEVIIAVPHCWPKCIEIWGNWGSPAATGMRRKKRWSHERPHQWN